MHIHNKEKARSHLLDNDMAWVVVGKQTGTLLAEGTERQSVPDQRVPAVIYMEAEFGKSAALPAGFPHEIRLVDLSSTKCKACKMSLKATESGLCEYCQDISVPNTQAVKGETGADTIKARESVYGPFSVHAKAEQDIKKAMTSQPGWQYLNDVQKSAAEMIVHKLARILNGSADYDDNWHDISGYATLAENEIKSRLSGSSSDEN